MKKRLLLLGGGFEQLNAVRIAKELGAEVIVFDGHASADCMHEADEFHQVNIKDRAVLLAKATDLRIDAVFVHAAELAIECAEVAEALNLPGISVQSATVGTDKVLRAAALQAAGVQVPSFRAVPKEALWPVWQKIAAKVGYPFMVKPTRLAGARGVEYIDSEKALASYFQQKESFGVQDFMLEHYVAGLQLSTESVALAGKLVATSVALRHYDTTRNLWPCQIEDGHSMPWHDEAVITPAIEAITEKCRAAFGIETGVLKGDIIVQPSGDITVLEMAVRTSGGRFCDTVVPLSAGITILYPLLQHALGQQPDISFLQPRRQGGVSQRFVLLPAGTKLRVQKALQPILLQPHVAGWWFRDDLRDLTEAPEVRSHRDRLGYVICTGETREIADSRAQAIVEQVAAAMTAGESA